MSSPEVCVGALILNERGQVLLIKSSKWAGKYIVPGGHIEPNESMQAAVIREVKEETNIDVDVLRLIDMQENLNNPQFHRKAHFFFISYQCRARNSDVRLQASEAQEYVWISLQDALALDLNFSSRKLINYYMSDVASRFESLYRLEKELREKCPWDKKQTVESMHKDLVDEVNEIKEAIDKKDFQNLSEEIGDVYQTLTLLAVIAEECHGLCLTKVLDDIHEKMVRRHPHVFGELKGKNLSAEEVTDNWKKIKEKEKNYKAAEITTQDGKASEEKEI